jgi:molybdopterin-guanine dinucleotide biosynthesis protein B
MNKPLISTHDTHVIAVASDAAVATHLPVLDLNDPEAIAGFILNWLENRPKLVSI